MTNEDQRSSFYVVQFKEKPFDDVEDYVCIPHGWLIVQKPSCPNIVVTYPDDENQSVTAKRVEWNQEPDHDWKFYSAVIKYRTDDYKDAENWMEKRNNCNIEKLQIKDTESEPEFNIKLRSGNQLVWSNSNLDKPKPKSKPKPKPTVKPYKNRRKPLPRILIKRPIPQNFGNILYNKGLKLNESGSQKCPIVIEDDPLIQIDQEKTSSASNISDILIQSTSTELLTAQEHSPKFADEQQLSPQPATDQQFLPRILTNRQSILKLTSEQQLSLTPSAEQQSSPVGQDCEQPLGEIVISLDESDEDSESYQTPPEPVTEERPFIKTPPIIVKEVPQPEPVNCRLPTMIRHDRGSEIPEQIPHDSSAGQSKESNFNVQTYRHCALNAPMMVPRRHSTTLRPVQQNEHAELLSVPESSILNSKPQLQEIVRRNSIEVTHNHQQQRSQSVLHNAPSTSNHESNGKKLRETLKPAATKLYLGARILKKPVGKKSCLKGAAKNVPTMKYLPNKMVQFSLPGHLPVMQTAPPAQSHLQPIQASEPLINKIDYRVPPLQGMANTATHNLSMLSQLYRPYVEVTREQQYLVTQEDYLQQFTRIKDMVGEPIMTQAIDQRIYHQHAMMNRGFVVQHQPNSMTQPIQLQRRSDNQFLTVGNAYPQEVIREELKRPIDGVQTIYNPAFQNRVNMQLVASTSANQLPNNLEHPHGKQNLSNYQVPCTPSAQNGLSLMSKRSSQFPEHHGVIKRTRLPLPTPINPHQELVDTQQSSLCQKMGIQERVNQSSTENRNINLVTISENPIVELVPNLRVRLQEVQSTLDQNKHVCCHVYKKKTVVDKATETDAIISVDRGVDSIDGPPFDQSVSKVDSVCQTDEYQSPNQDNTSDFESATFEEMETETDLALEVNQTNLVGEKLTPENQQEQYLVISGKILTKLTSLINQLGASTVHTREMFNSVRNSALIHTEAYESLIEMIEECNSMDIIQKPTSSPNKVTSQAPQVVPDKDNNHNTNTDHTSTSTHNQRRTFSLPPEYDPEDTKWTLKFREKKRGLVELLPRTLIYVTGKGLKRCINESGDCRTLARSLLTEVFSKNALSVCSLTGSRARAFNSLDIDVRPGLDEYAKMVLLHFVEQHGTKQGWDVSDTAGIMSSIRSRINEIRKNHT